MTTKVTIDAHGGRAVHVGLQHGEPGSGQSVSVEIVPSGTTRDIFIHSGLRIVGIHEAEDVSEPEPTIGDSDGTDGA